LFIFDDQHAHNVAGVAGSALPPVVYSPFNPEPRLNGPFIGRSTADVYRRTQGEHPMMKILMAALAAYAINDGAANVTGTWNMGLQGGHVVPVALVLKQDGKTVTGTITLPTQHGDRKDVEMKGEFDAGALKISGEVDGAVDPTTIEIEGKLLEDGSMEGTVAMIAKETHRMQWTAERLKERKR
jgi:hypothetical protein